MTQYIDVPIMQGVTIEHIAEQYLGDASMWTQLVLLNRLRYPYLSEDPRDREGTTLAQTQVRPNYRLSNAGDTGAAPTYTQNVLAGDTIIATLDDIQVSFGQNALFINFSNTSGPTWEVQPILGMIHATVNGPVADPAVAATYGQAWVLNAGTPPLLILQNSVALPWTAGTELTVHQNPAEETSRCLGPGDYIRVPTNNLGSTLLVPTNYADLLGIDIQLQNGFIQYNTTGDITTVSGIGNLQQALYDRLTTAVGNLPLHSDYGDILLDQVGRTGNPALLTLANAYARQAVAADARIGVIASSSATLNGQLLKVDVSAQVKSLPQLVQVSAELALGSV